MKILYIDVNYKNSSTGEIVSNLHKCCKQGGIESSVCYGRGAKVNEPNVFKFGINLETYIHAMMTRITGYTGSFSYFSTKRLINYIKKFEPDIVHIHELHAYFVNIKQLLTYLKKHHIKTIFTNHCEFLYTGKCGHAKSCDKYSNHCGKCPLLKEYPKSIFFDHTSHMLNVKKSIFKDWNNIYVVSPSNWLAEKMKISFLKNVPHSVIHNGIDTNIFRYNKKEEKQTTVLSIAPNIFSKMKGGYRILNISKQMQKENIKFVLVGATEPFPTVPNYVKLYGPIYNKKELAKLYANADCFLIMSEYENFPTTAIEAQCCGTKVVGYDVGGVKEAILKDNGYVVPYLNEKGIINAIKECVNNGYDKALISQNACACYSIKTMFNKYLKIYNKILK